MRFILIFILSVCFESSLFCQNETPSIVIPASIISGLLEGKPFESKKYCDQGDSTKYFIVDIQNKEFRGISLIMNGHEVKLYLYKNGQIMFLTQFESDKVNGPFIYFSKNGIVELIVKYKDSKLVGVIYSVNDKVLKRYLKKYGLDSPVSIKKETKVY